jgi:hypothetical protein
MTRPRLALFLVFVLLLIGVPASAPASPFNHGDDRWALIIGIDHFQGRTRPNFGAVGDAQAFADLLRQKGWRDDRVRVLTDGAASSDAMRAGFQWIVDNCGPSSYCVVHYSGHTKQARGSGDGEVLHEFLWPHDNRFISDSEFGSYMRQLRGYAWVDVSACEPAGFDHGISSPRRLFTAAAQESEKGFEDPGWRRSVWTGLLVDQALLGRQGDTGGDGHVTLREAIDFAVPRAAEMTARHKPGPQHPYVAGGEETQWFGPPGPPAPARRCFLIFCSPGAAS